MIFILANGIAIGIAIVGLVFVHTRPVTPGVKTAAHVMHAVTLLVSTTTATATLAHLGEPQACWLVDLMGVAIDACNP